VLPLAEAVRYGPDSEHVANLHRPAGEGPWPSVVVVHGGFWRDRYDRTVTTSLAEDLARRGMLAWNVEYRRVGRDGGGWPGTLEDVAAALDALLDVVEADRSRVVLLGHSAGGQLALWLAARHRLAQDAPGAAPRLRPRAAISLAGVVDLERASELGIGNGACDAFRGGSAADVPERYAVASPLALLPLGVPQLLVHGSRDEIVPVELSRRYANAAQEAGDEVELVELPAADHFDVVDSGHEAWAAVVERLPRLLGA
jgi:acetyl esterase/lipase